VSASTPIEPAPARQSSSSARGWEVRGARPEDVVQIAAAVAELLVELGGTPPPGPAMQATARALLADGDAGTVLVAEAGGTLVGVLAVSWQTAIHTPGRYALIQDLWVHPAWRGRAIGRELLSELFALAREQGVACVEVGLPRDRFAGLRATQAFYGASGFAPLGTRMRRVLA
jgi:GNAT superfamily N-acetyltransferase